MSKSFRNFFSAAAVVAGLLLVAPAVSGQTQNGSPLADQNGVISKSGMSPMMAPDGPMAPENNANFTEQHVSDNIRENMAVEIELSQLALQRSQNASVQKFARQVIAENTTLSAQAKQLAPDKSGVFPNPMFEGTREAVDARAAEKKMNAVTGSEFDKLYLNQMNSYAQNDQQVGHSAYAIMEFPGISPVGRKMWDMANARVEQIDKLAKDLHIELGLNRRP